MGDANSSGIKQEVKGDTERQAEYRKKMPILAALYDAHSEVYSNVDATLKQAKNSTLKSIENSNLPKRIKIAATKTTSLLFPENQVQLVTEGIALTPMVKGVKVAGNGLYKLYKMNRDVNRSLGANPFNGKYLIKFIHS